MLRTVNSMKGYRLRALDGEIGKVKDFYFDDEDWGLRYLVADTGTWLPKRMVLIAPPSLGQPDWEQRLLPVSLNRKQIEESPPIAADLPVSRQFEQEFHTYYSLAPYWSAYAPPPVESATGRRPMPGGSGGAATVSKRDTHLRSTREVTGYHIEATDDEIGHVEEFIVETEAWMIRYIVVDTRNWLPGRKVLVSPRWIDDVRWADNIVRVDMTRDQVKNAPEFDPNMPVNREYETALYDYYGRPHYW